MSNEEKSKKENSSKKTIIIVVAIITLIILITFIVITIINKNSSRELERENNNYQAKYYGNFYGNEIKKIALFYYLNNNKMISSNELEEAIKNIEDHNFTGSEIKFSDIKCKSIKTEENGDLKLIDCNSDLFNSKKNYTFEANILEEIKKITYKDINSSFTENEINTLAKIRKINIKNIKYSIGCNKNETDGSLKYIGNVLGDEKYIGGYIKTTRNNEVTTDENILENDDVEIYVCKRININDNFKTIDLSLIDLNTKLKETEYEPEKLKELAETTGEAIFEMDYKYKLDNNIFYIKDNNNYSKEYNNVKKVYYAKGESCGFLVKFFIITNDKIIVTTIDASKQEQGKNSIEEITSYINKSYDSIYSVFVHSLTCGAEYDYIGHKEDGMFYNLTSGEKINLDIKYNYYNILTIDRKFNYKDTKLNVKIVFKSNVIKTIEYVVDNNDYLYGEASNEKTKSFKKLSNKKVKKIYYNEQNKYAYIQFEDDTFYNNNPLEWIYIEY